MKWPARTRPSSSPRTARRGRRVPRLERLENRALLAGNLLVVDQVPGQLMYHLQEYTQGGARVSSVTIPQTAGQPGYQEGARGVTVDSLGKFDLINGDSQPYLSTFSPSTGTWSHQNFIGWGLVGNISYGTVGALGNDVYASNLSSAGGIVRFDVTGGPTVAFASGKGFTQVAVGQDGLIYGLDTNSSPTPQVDAYDPATLALVKTVKIPSLSNADNDWRTLAVDASGDIFVGSWAGYFVKMSPAGTVQTSVRIVNGQNVMNMVIDGDGQIAIGGRNGTVFLTDTSLGAYQMIETGQWNAFVTFKHYIPATVAPRADAGGPYSVPEGGTVALDASKSTDLNQDPSTLTYLWDLNGDGIFGETGAAATRGGEVGMHPVFDASGLGGSSTQTVRLKVIDGNGLSSVASATIGVVNQAPVVTVQPGSTSLHAGDTLTATGSFSDPGVGEAYSATVDYGDGGGPQPLTLADNHAFGLSHAYAAPGLYPVTVRVSDGTDAGTASVTVSVASTLVTPVFDSLLGPTIRYGDGPTTLGGRIAAGSSYPPGSVWVTLAGVTTTAPGVSVAAPINPADGTFSITCDTTDLGVTGSPYAISYTYPGGGNFAPAQDLTKTLVVTPRVLTVTTQDAGKTYGDPDPTFSVAYDGFAPGEGPSNLGGLLSFTTNEPAGGYAPAGKYAVTPGGLNSPNYAIAYVPGTLTVAPRALTVTAHDASKIYGQPAPAFIAGASGFATGEGLQNLGGALTFSTNEPDPLTAPAGTYAVTPGGLSSPNYAMTYIPGVLTVNRATTSLGGLTTTTVVVGTPTTTFSGVLNSNSVLPVGQAVTVTIVGASGPLATGSGVIRYDGTFSAVVNTVALPGGMYTVKYAYAGDPNFTPSRGTGTLTETYKLDPHYDPSKPVHGNAVNLKMQVTDAAGNNLSSPSLVVTAVQLVDSQGLTFTPKAQGGSNPGNALRNTGTGYMYYLDLSGLAPGKYTLLVAIGEDPVLHALTFTVV
jgi:hypothetical protein